MHKIITLLTVVTSITAQAQNDPGQSFLASARKNDLVFAELNGNSGVVFRLGQMMDKGGTGYTLVYTDTLVNVADHSALLYNGNLATVSKAGENIVLTFREDSKSRWKSRKMVNNKISEEVNYKLNNAYWWSKFSPLSQEIDSLFPMHYFSFRYGFTYWNGFLNKDIYYKDFRTLADRRIKSIRDSIIAEQATYTRITDYIISNIASIEYTALRDNLFLLPDARADRYFAAAVNSVCMNRPEFFFMLAADRPDKKYRLFNAVDRNKETMNKLRSVSTDDAVRKEFFRKAY